MDDLPGSHNDLLKYYGMTASEAVNDPEKYVVYFGKKFLTLEQVIRKMTGQTADFLLVKNKGYIRDGYDADLVLFDYDALRDTATYDRPNSITEGIKGVYIGGKLVYDGKAFTGAAPGRMIRHNR